MAKTDYSAHGIGDLLTAGSQSFVDASALVTVPNTTIVNRAQIPSLTADLRASMGIDRIMTQYMYMIPNETGPNGETVFGIVNDTRDQIRLIGIWGSNEDANGQRIVTAANTAATIEIVFYGTGINLLGYLGDCQNMYYSLDGGAPTQFFSAPISSTLGGRLYSPNQVFTIVSGLTLAVHTVKLSAVNGYFDLTGFEIINAGSSITINPGTAYTSGKKTSLTASTLFTSTTGVTGTKGGRQLVYLNADGTIGNAFQAVDASIVYLGSASHANEELIRSYNWREFGSGRGDDFSSTNASGSTNKCFTLDDGTTTLNIQAASQQISNSYDAVLASAVNAVTSFTFIGTGLDIMVSNDNGSRSDTLIVDGVAAGTLTAAANEVAVKKIVSGLPYGTHTIRLTSSGGAASIRYVKFNVYGPKKPTLPTGAIEISDFNVMGNYVANTNGTIYPSTGVMRKTSIREVNYVGTWTGPTGVDPAYAGGFNVFSSTAASYAEYTFYGTGCEWKSWMNSSVTVNQTISIDGSTNLSGFTTGFHSANAGTVTLTPATGLLSGTTAASPAYGVTVRIAGLTLGLHKIRVTYNSGTAPIYVDCFDVITPIYSAKSNVYGTTHNALPVGSQSLADTRKTSMVKDSVPGTKAWAQAVGISSGVTTTSTSYIPLPDMSLTIKTSGGPIQVNYSASVFHSAAAQAVYIKVFVDGLAVGAEKAINAAATGYDNIIADSVIIPVSAGAHKVDLYWQTNSGTATADSIRRSMNVREI